MMHAFITLLGFFAVANSFQSSSRILIRRNVLQMGFFDDLKVIFSKEGQENLKALKDREQEEALLAQKEILARRKDPKKMREYEEKNEANRIKLAEDRAVYKFQGTVKEGTV
jgi:hypothetical protein